MLKTISMLILCLLFVIKDVSQQDPKILYIHYDWQPYTMNEDGTHKIPFMDCPIPESENVLDCFGMSYPDWSPNGNGFIATNYRIYFVDAQTKDIAPLTTLEDGHILWAKWSPNGEKIAFVTASGQLYVMNRDGLNQTLVTTGGLDGFTWIWDDNHILFVRHTGIHFDEDTQTYEDGHLYLVNIADGTLTELTTHVNQCHTGEFYAKPTWSPVSQQLVFAMGCNLSASALYLVEAESLDKLLAFDYISLSKNDVVLRETIYIDIAWSPLGDKIAFIAYIRAREVGDTRSYEIVILNVPETLMNNEPVYQEITDTPIGIDYDYRGLTWVRDYTW